MERYFLGMDFQSNDIIPVGLDTLDFIQNEYGDNFIREKIGVKLNDYSLRKDFRRFSEFSERGCKIFADIKICHGFGTGYRIIQEVNEELPVDYVTLAAFMLPGVLKKYVERGKEDGIKMIGFTVHTKTAPEEVTEYLGTNVTETIHSLGKAVSDSGCDAMVLDGPKLSDKRIRNLPIKKLVTGMRIDPSDKGEQARVTPADHLESVKDHVDYLVISSRYLKDYEKINEILTRF